jgi:hypothetical protein
MSLEIGHYDKDGFYHSVRLGCPSGTVDAIPWARPDRLTKKKKTARSNRGAYLGVSEEAYASMLEAQGGVCAICGKPETSKRGSLSIDHDHATGRVRGLLCHACNIGLGNFRDTEAILRGAIEYLKPEK